VRADGERLMVEDYMWVLAKETFPQGIVDRMFRMGYSIAVRYTGIGRPVRDLYSGSPRTFVNALFNGQDLGACFVRPFRGEDGSACSYIDTILGTALLGLVLMGGTLLMQCSLCCARYFPCLEFCGICCGEPACGNRLPTKRRKKQWVFRCNLALFFLSGTLVGEATLGWRTTVQLEFDGYQAIEAMDFAISLKDIFRNTTEFGFRELRVEGKERMQIINRRLSSLSNLTQQTVEANRTMVELKKRIDAIRSFIEGKRNGTQQENPCTFYDRPTGLPLTFDTLLLLWRLPDGNESIALNPPAKHDFGVGSGQVLTNGRVAPTCTKHTFVATDYQPEDMECPCCRECVIYDNAVTEGIEAMPGRVKFEKLDQRLPWEFLDADIDALEWNLERGIQVIERRMDQVIASMALFRTVMTEVLSAMAGVQFLLWGLTVLAVAFISLGQLISSYKCLFYGYFVGTVACVVILFPFFTFGSLLVLPFGDACAGIPRTGGDTSSFLSTFSPTGDLRDVNVSTVRMVQDCLASESGNVWNVAGMDRNVVFDSLFRYDIADKVQESDILTTLNTDENDLTLAFSNHKDSMERLTADNKIFGYDSQPNEVDDQGYTTFLNGGVIDGSRFEALVNIVNIELVSTYTERDLLTECQRLAIDPETDGCFRNDTDLYDAECCPVNRFTTQQARVPAQKVYDYNIYRSMLQERMFSMQQTLLSVDVQLTEIKRDSLILERNISFMRVEAANEVNRITDRMMEIGSCAPFNDMYETLRVPFCENLNKSLDSVWMMCFILGCSWFPYFFIILRNMKLIMLKKGFGKVGSAADKGKRKADKEAKRKKKEFSSLNV